MNGKTVIITGANSGIGKETARELARKGARVVLVCRHPERGESALRELSQELPGQFDLLIADLSSLKAIETLAGQLLERYPRIDVLLHNAGVYFENFTESPDGIEMTLAVNHLAVFHLTNLLIERLKQSAPSRIVIVSSGMHMVGRIQLDDLEYRRRGFSATATYASSKLLNIFFMKELQRQLLGTGVTVNCLHPGVVATNIFNSNSRVMTKFISGLVKPFMLSPARGARTSIMVASDPRWEGVSGKYFRGSRASFARPGSDNPELARQIWEASEALIKSRP
jgi:NAD(P)-dependent dehydrogenase (short-subunit alcohol dehydrogenase family)